MNKYIHAFCCKIEVLRIAIGLHLFARFVFCCAPAMRCAAGVLVVLMLGLLPGHAQKRVALVIGNNNYTNLPADEQLRKAVNDASAVGNALARLGFEVVRGENLSRQAFIKKIDELVRRLSPGDTAFFFFSGHGVAIDGSNYILPSDVPDVANGEDTLLKRAAVGEHEVISDLRGRGVRVAVMVLDSCRKNPFRRLGTKAVGGEKGLVRSDPVPGVFSLYAAGIGQTALDRLGENDSDPNSVFTRVFVPALSKPGLDLPALAVEVREEVAKLARTVHHNQRPAYYDETIGGRVYLAGPLLEQADKRSMGGAAQAWNAWVKDTKSVAVLEDFIHHYEDTTYATLAAKRLAMLAPKKQTQGFDPCGEPIVLASLSRRRSRSLSEAEECGLKPKDVFKECDTCPEMVVISAGDFLMGSPQHEKERDSNEGPRHLVAVAKPLAVARFAVTVAEFAKFVAATGYDTGDSCWVWDDSIKSWNKQKGRSWRYPGFRQERSHPVVCVSWDDAKAYVAWLSSTTGKPYRLLTGAEREYATRAGTTTPFWWGWSISPTQANYDADFSYMRGPVGEYRKKTVPVNSFRPNPWGLYQVHGNVLEWVEDCWHEHYNGAPSDASAWITGNDCSRRVLRGGAWDSVPQRLRSSGRDWGLTDHRESNSGFRVARTLLLIHP